MANPAPMRPIKANPTHEYVGSGLAALYGKLGHTLPRPFDDLTRDFGDDIYERMLVDSKVAASMGAYKARVLDDGWELSSAIEDEADPQAKLAADILAFSQYALDRLRTPFADVLWDALDAIAFGNRVGELVYELAADGEYKGKLVLVAVKMKPRRAIGFVVDAFKNLIGLIGAKSGQPQVMAGTLTSAVELLPREKFLIFTNRPVDGDPRGTSILRAAYNCWWLKVQLWGQYLKYLTQFGSPSLIGFTAQGAQGTTATDSLGNPVEGANQLSPEEAMVAALVQFQSGTAIAFPPEYLVQVVEAQGNGEAFLNAFELLDRSITEAILNQSLATQEGQHQARAAAEVHNSVFTNTIGHTRKQLARVIRADILTPLIRYNFGEEAAALAPNVSLGETEEDDRPTMMQAIAGLQSAGYLDPSQYVGIDELLGLPQRSPESIALAQEAQKIGVESQRIALETPQTPPNGAASSKTPLKPESKPTADTQGVSAQSSGRAGKGKTR